jgi:hypothetical protein
MSEKSCSNTAGALRLGSLFFKWCPQNDRIFETKSQRTKRIYPLIPTDFFETFSLIINVEVSLIIIERYSILYTDNN